MEKMNFKIHENGLTVTDENGELIEEVNKNCQRDIFYYVFAEIAKLKKRILEFENGKN